MDVGQTEGDRMSQQSVFSDLGDLGHLNRIATPVPKPAFSGAWTTIDLQPDLFVPQRFTVGVAVQSPGGRLHFKLLDDIKKFDCVYGGRYSHRSLREILAYAEHTLRKAVQSCAQIPDIRFETSALSLAAPSYTSGEDQEATTERLFEEVVVMARSENTRRREFESIDTPQARKLVNQELKRIAQMDYDKIVTSGDQGVLVDFDGQRHFLDLNLLTRLGCGSVTSAVYKSYQSVEVNLLRTSRDLTTYSRVRNADDIGLFLLLPEATALEQKEYKRITEVIDEHEWKLVRDGFRVVSFDSPALLAQEIYEWAKPAIE